MFFHKKKIHCFREIEILISFIMMHILLLEFSGSVFKFSPTSKKTLKLQVRKINTSFKKNGFSLNWLPHNILNDKD